MATPIGNLADASLRSLHVLELVDAIACEDTRQCQSLLRAMVSTARRRPAGLHQHNERGRRAVIRRLQAGRTRGPGERCRNAGPSATRAAVVEGRACGRPGVVVIPGPSSVTAALSVAGCNDAQGPGIRVRGLPASARRRTDRAPGVDRQEPRAVVLLEAPHRIGELLQGLTVLGQRR